MASRVVPLTFFLFFSACAVTTTDLFRPQPGIDRELARRRAESIRDVRYDLRFEIVAGMQRVRGEATIQFELEAKQPVVIDFAGSGLGDVRVNDASVALEKVHNHIVIAPADVREGINTFHATFESKVAPTGTPLTVYRDKADGSEYYYTLVVPADAHRLFPCFDQPDIKGKFTITVDAPKGYQVVANSGVGDAPTHGPTPPLPTYLFAFAAGPFEKIIGPALDNGAAGDRPMHLYVRKSKLDKLERDVLFAMHGDAVRWLSEYFGYPYPFDKLDMVLVPGFPYGGMEHAGAIFYRETALIFEQAPTEGELTRRSTLIYHEVSHQWFGNLVTMKWFDDLWLKEGFATFMGYTLFEALEPGKHAWLRFHHRVKPRAYRVDSTAGTTPVYQQLANLADAKSAYGAIVYNKAPAIIRELNHRLGPANFQQGLRLFLKRHEFDNATWQDLVAALEEAAQESAAHWSSRWILAAGMPRVHVEWNQVDGKIASFAVHQGSVQSDAGIWPLQLEAMLLAADGSHVRVELVADGAVTPVDELIGHPAPACVLLNPGDVAYGQFLLDEASRAWLIEHVREIRDPLVRAVAMSALYETVREAQLDPATYAATALALLAGERDAGTHAWLLGTLHTTLRRYMSASRRAPLAVKLVEILFAQLRGDNPAIKTQTLRFLIGIGAGEQVRALCRSVAAGESPVSGLEVGKRDRFLAAAALLAAGDGRVALDQLVADFGDEDVGRDTYIAAAADPSAKKAYFGGYHNLDEPPEQWVSMSLGNFHWQGQEALTLPYLRAALERVEWVKENRKIFFMPAWIDAFINGHSSRAALDVVTGFLAEYSDLPIDIRRKILQSLDSLQRAVEIQSRWN